LCPAAVAGALSLLVLASPAAGTKLVAGLVAATVNRSGDIGWVQLQWKVLLCMEIEQHINLTIHRKITAFRVVIQLTNSNSLVKVCLVDCQVAWMKCDILGLEVWIDSVCIAGMAQEISPVFAGLLIGLLTGLLIGLAESSMAGVVSMVSLTHATKAPFVSRQ